MEALDILTPPSDERTHGSMVLRTRVLSTRSPLSDVKLLDPGGRPVIRTGDHAKEARLSQACNLTKLFKLKLISVLSI